MQRLSGEIPCELSRLSALKVLCLQANQLSDPIPADFCRLTKLVDLRLHSCSRLCGPIPLLIGNLHSLETLYLHGTGLSGDIPPSFINLGKLKDLSLHSCKFSQTSQSILPLSTIINSKERIRTFFKELTKMHARREWLMSDTNAVEKCWSALGGAEANLKGDAKDGIPTDPSAWRGITIENSRVTKVDWSHLGLGGSLSESIGDLTALTTLRLNNNYIHGGIPASLGKLRSLRGLALEHNAFYGEVPATLESCESLVFLNLIENPR